MTTKDSDTSFLNALRKPIPGGLFLAGLFIFLIGINKRSSNFPILGPIQPPDEFRVPMAILGVVLMLLAAVISFAKREPSSARKGEFIDVDISEINGGDARIRVPYESRMTVDNLLDFVWRALSPQPPAGEYGRKWVLRKESNVEELYEMGSWWVGENPDERTLNKVGIQTGDKLKALWAKPRHIIVDVSRLPQANPNQKILRYCVQPNTSVGVFLSWIETKVPSLPDNSYGKKWTLRNSKGNAFNDIGAADKKRLLDEVGILNDDRLEATMPKS